MARRTRHRTAHWGAASLWPCWPPPRPPRVAQAGAPFRREHPVSELVVTAPRQEVKARIVQLIAPNLISVRSAETILKYPDYNAAEALGRMPGISLSSDTGEGRFVQIRGIDANLDGATYGGVPLLNTNPGGTAAGGGGRAVEFDTIPDRRGRRPDRHLHPAARPRGRGPGRLDRADARAPR